MDISCRSPVFRNTPRSSATTSIPQATNMAKILQVQILEKYRKPSESILYGFHSYSGFVVFRYVQLTLFSLCQSIQLTIIVFPNSLDSMREMSKYAGELNTDQMGSRHVDAELQHSMKLFRAQRNFYIAGFALFLFSTLR